MFVCKTYPFPSVLLSPGINDSRVLPVHRHRAVPYQSLVVETGTGPAHAVKRFREFVVFHAEQICPEYVSSPLVAICTTLNSRLCHLP